MMNDGPGLAAWDLANARTCQADLERSEYLRRVLGLGERSPERAAAREKNARIGVAMRERRAQEAPPSTPWWPKWATSLALVRPGWCASCSLPLGNRNRSGFCGKCQKRAGRNHKRMALALQLYRAGKWSPGGRGAAPDATGGAER